MSTDKSPTCDRDLIILAAEKIMGATPIREQETLRYVIPGSQMPLFVHDEDSAYSEKLEGWNPLTSIADAFMLADKLESDGWLFSIGRDSSGDHATGWVAGLHRISDSRHPVIASGDDRCRAIVLACLATGEGTTNSADQDV